MSAYKCWTSIWQIFEKLRKKCNSRPETGAKPDDQQMRVISCQKMHFLAETVQTVPLPPRGGRLTSLEASFARCFAF